MVETEPDEVLAVRARDDRDAFAELYQRYVKRIYSYIYYRTGSVADAEDLCSKVFFQAFTHLPRYQVVGVPFSAWLFRIAHNLVANWHRDSERRRAEPLEEALELPNPADAPADHAEVAEERHALHAALRKLPADRQQLLILKFVEDMSNADIGVVMGRTEGAVKALLHRTILNLRDELSRRERARPGKARQKKVDGE